MNGRISYLDRDILDAITPQYTTLSARYKHSLSYLILSHRMPGILLQIVNRINMNSDKLMKQYGNEAAEEIKKITESIMRFRTYLHRNGTFGVFKENQPDKNEWNNFIYALPRNKRFFYSACWIHCECYFYRRIHSYFENSKYLNNYDYYADLKHEDMEMSDTSVQSLAKATRYLRKNQNTFNLLLRISLWSNRYDFVLQSYILPNAKNPQNVDALASVEFLNSSILADDSDKIWDCLHNAMIKYKKKNVVIDFICDNAGFEIFTDLLFIEYLLDKELVTKVRLHVKPIPWYLSDTTKEDVDWTLNYLKKHKNEYVRAVGINLVRLMKSGRLCMAPQSYFWVGPQNYFVMADIDEELFRLLTTAKLAIFKGDVNYRKLVGDYTWDSEEELLTCLRGFRPCNICAIRSIKCEVLCGLPEGVPESVSSGDPQWTLSGKYGVIQYTDSFKCDCEM